MEGLSGDYSSQGLSAELVGLLILNELKCFRKELTNEVKNLARKLDLVTGENICQKQKVNNAQKNANLLSSWKPNNVFQAVGRDVSIAANSESSSFKEISPETDNGILSNHIAFRMSKSYSSNEANDLDISGAYHETSTNNFTSSDTYQESCEKDLTVAESYHGTNLEDMDELPGNSLDDVSTWASSTDKASTNMPQHSAQQTSNEKNTDKNKLKSKCSVIYKCTLCQEQFDSQVLYFEHYSSSHSNNESSTALSLKSFWQDQSIKNVFDQPQPKLIYVCSVCSRHFSSKGSLLRHSVLHSGVKKFVCKLCGKRFFRSDHLKSHLPTHSRQKQYQCPLCQKYFSRSLNFENHMKMHKNMSEAVGTEENPVYFNAPLESEETYNLANFIEEDYCIKEEGAEPN